jgi:hypothetical protein
LAAPKLPALIYAPRPFTDENPIFALTAFHALLVKHEWVFSHLCEARHAIRRAPRIRAQLEKQALEDFAEFSDTAAQAMHHYVRRYA